MKSFFGTGSFKRRRTAARNRAKLNGRQIVAESDRRFLAANVESDGSLTIAVVVVDPDDPFGCLNETRIEVFTEAEVKALAAMFEGGK